jgi:hypothetical protein
LGQQVFDSCVRVASYIHRLGVSVRYTPFCVDFQNPAIFGFPVEVLRLALVDDDLTALDHHFGVEHRIDVFQRIALKQDDVGHLAWLD